MIVVGHPETWSPRMDRREILEMGAIVAIVHDDKLRRLWLGAADGTDFFMVEAEAADGTHYYMGRIRFQEDDKLFDSNDHKERIQVAVSPECVESADTILAPILEVMKVMSGIQELREYPLAGGGPRSLHEAFRRATEDFPGWEYACVELPADDTVAGLN